MFYNNFLWGCCILLLNLCKLHSPSPPSSLYLSSSWILSLIGILLSLAPVNTPHPALPCLFPTISFFYLISVILSYFYFSTQRVIHQYKCFLSSCWNYRVFFFNTLTRGRDTINSPTAPCRSFIATKRRNKQMDFRGWLSAAGSSA